MKHTNKYIALIAILGLSFYGSTYAAEVGVDNINTIDANTLSVSLSENPDLGVGEIEAEVTILKDMQLRGGFISEDDSSSVELILEDALTPNTIYSLLTVTGAEGSIDFTTGDDVEGFTAENITTTDDQDIANIEVIDDRTILLNYRTELNSSMFEYKLLAESEVVKIEKPDYDFPELIISVEPEFASETDYILMFIELQDLEGNYIEFDTGIYDFTTPELAVEEATGTGTVVEEATGTGTVVEEEMVEAEVDNTMLEDIEMNAAGDDTSLEKDGESEMDVLEAMHVVSETPDTGAQTWVLILLTLVINSFYYLSRRKASLVRA